MSARDDYLILGDIAASGPYALEHTLALDEIDRLRAERDAWKADAERLADRFRLFQYAFTPTDRGELAAHDRLAAEQTEGRAS